MPFQENPPRLRATLPSQDCSTATIAVVRLSANSRRAATFITIATASRGNSLSLTCAKRSLPSNLTSSWVGSGLATKCWPGLALLRESRLDEKQEHEAAIAGLKTNTIGCRTIHARCVEKFDGRIDKHFFEKLSADWRKEQDKCLREISWHRPLINPISKRASASSISPTAPSACSLSRSRTRSAGC